MFEYREVARPYPGLRPFDPWETEIFFGRETHTDRLLEILQREHFLAVIGPSGSGKSSLVRAGLLPALPSGAIGTGSDWRVAVMRPGSQPMRALAKSLLAPNVLGNDMAGPAEKSDRDHDRQIALAEAELHRGPRGLLDLAQLARQPGSDDEEGFNLLVLVDQFEELFTYTKAGGRQADESEAFVNLLLAARAQKLARVFVAITMRTDFLGTCVSFLDLPEAINRAQYLTPRLTNEQMTAAITGPSRVFGGDIDPTLVNELINAVGKDPDQLPVLQHALSRMWNEARARDAQHPSIGWHDYKTVGQIDKALSKHADEVLDLIPKANRSLTEWLFRAITEQRQAEAGGQAVRRPLTLKLVAQWGNKPWHDFVPVVEAFTQPEVSLLHYEGVLDDQAVIDISHEALIRKWDRLRAWVENEARNALEYQEWRQWTRDWKNRKGSLLRDADLARAREWRAGRAAGVREDNWVPNEQWADRYPDAGVQQSPIVFADIEEFIERSHLAEQQELDRERRTKRWFQWLSIACVAAFAVAMVMAKMGHEASIRAEAGGLWHPLDFSDPYRNATQEDGLIGVARAPTAWKEPFLRRIFENESLATKFMLQPQELIRAALGISRSRRDQTLQYFVQVQPDSPSGKLARVRGLMAMEGPLRVDDYVQALLLTADDYQLSSLVEGLKAMVSTGAETQAAGGVEQLVAAIRSSTYSSQLYTLGEGLKAAAGKVPESQAAGVVEKLVAAIGSSKDTYQWSALGNGLQAAAGKVPESQAAGVVEKLMVTIGSSKDSYQVSTLLEGLVALPEQSWESQAAGVIGKLASAIGSSTNLDQLRALGERLKPVAEKVPESQAADVVQSLIAAIGSSTHYAQPGALGEGLKAAARRVSQSQVAGVVQSLVAAIGSSAYPYQLSAMVEGLVELREQLWNSQAAGVVEKLMATIGSSKDSDQLSALGKGLQAVAENVPESQAADVVEKLVAAIVSSTNPYQPSALGEGLKAAAGQVPEPQTVDVVEKLVAAIGLSTNSDQLRVLVEQLAVFPGRLWESQAAGVVGRLVAAIGSSKDSSQPTTLVEGLRTVAGKVPESQAAGVVEKLMATIGSSKDSDQLSALGKGLQAVAENVPESRAAGLVEKLVAAIVSSTNPYQPSALGEGLKAAAGQVPESEAARAVKTLVAAIASSTDSSFHLSILVEALEAAVEKVPEPQAAGLVGTLVAAIGSSKDSDQWSALGEGLKAAAAKVGESQAAGVMQELVATIESNTDFFQLSALGEGLVAVAAKVPESHAAGAVQNLAAAIGSTTDSKHLGVLVEGLVAGKVPESQAAGVMEKLIVAIVQNTSDKLRSTLVEGLRAVAESLPESQVASAVEKLVAAIGSTTDYSQQRALAEGLKAVARQVPESQGASVMEKLAPTMSLITDSGQFRVLIEGLQAMMGKVPESQAAADVVERLAAAIRSSTNAYQLSDLVEQLVALPARLWESQAADVVEKLISLLVASSTGFDQWPALSEALKAVAKKVPESQAAGVVEKLMSAIAGANRGDQIRAISDVVPDVADRTNAQDPALLGLFEVIKYPLVPREEIVKVLRQKFSAAPGESDGFWSFVAWAEQHFPEVDFNTPPAFGSAEIKPSRFKLHHALAFVPQSFRWGLFSISLLVCTFLGGWLKWRGQALINYVAPHGGLSYQLAWTAERAGEIMCSWERDQITDVARRHFQLEYLLTFFYVLSLSLAFALPIGTEVESIKRIGAALSWFVVLAGVFSCIENFVLLRMLSIGARMAMTRLAGVCAVLKYVIFSLCVFYFFIVGLMTFVGF